jgi:hypothetical protein
MSINFAKWRISWGKHMQIDLEKKKTVKGTDKPAFQ